MARASVAFTKRIGTHVPMERVEAEATVGARPFRTAPLALEPRAQSLSPART